MGILSQDLDKTAQCFVREAVYWIMALQSVMLTEIGRQLESRISLKKIEERFSSENDEILAAIDQVGEAVQNMGIWVIV